MTELQGIVDIFAGAPSGSRARANLDALLNIQHRSQERFSAQDPPPDQFLSHMTTLFGMPSVESTSTTTNREDDDDDDTGHVPMMGWDTRLVLRLKAGAQSQGISIPGPNISPRVRGVKRSSRASQQPASEQALFALTGDFSRAERVLANNEVAEQGHVDVINVSRPIPFCWRGLTNGGICSQT